MINFSTIVPLLQVQIAEKMSYFDQMELGSSSRCGKEIINYTRFKPVIDVVSLRLSTNGAVAFIVRRKDADVYKNWTTVSAFCRFNISRVVIFSEILLDSLFGGIFDAENELLVKSKVELICYVSLSTQIFTKLADVFDVNTVEYRSNLNPDLFSESSFVNVPCFKAAIGGYIPDESLLKMKSRLVVLHSHSDRISTIANLFLHQWFHKERTIDLFRIEQHLVQGINKETAVNGLPITTIWQYEREPNLKVTFLKECFPEKRLIKYDAIYSVDRGDKKLLIIPSLRDLISLEYDELDDVIQFDKILTKNKHPRFTNVNK